MIWTFTNLYFPTKEDIQTEDKKFSQLITQDSNGKTAKLGGKNKNKHCN